MLRQYVLLYRQYFVLSVLSVFFIFSYTAMAMPDGAISPARSIEVSIIKGEQMVPLLNNKAENYSVMSVNEGRLVAIPYQFDDVNLRGFIWLLRLIFEFSEKYLKPGFFY